MADPKLTAPKIPIIDPHGQMGTIDPSQADDAVKNLGFRIPSPEEIQAFQAQQQYGTGVLNPLLAGAESAGSAATLGLSRELENASGLTTPEAQAARKTYNPMASTVGTGVGIAAPIAASILAGPEVGASAIAAEGAEGAGAAAAASGAADAGSSLAGAARGALASDALPINAVGKMGRGISDALLPADMASMGPVSKILAQAGAHGMGSAIEGAAFGLGQSVDEDALGDPDALGEKLLPNMMTGAGFGALIGGGIGAAGPMLKGVGEMLPNAKSLGKKLLSTFGGMSEKDIDAYMTNREAVNNAPHFDEVYGQALSHVQDLQDQVQAKTISAQDAKAALDAKATEIKQQFQDLGYDTRKAKTLAQDALDRAQDELANRLQSQALDQAPKIAEAVEGLHQNVVAGSADAFDVLSQQEGMVPLRGFFGKAAELQEKLRSQATLEAKAMADRIGQYVENVKAEHGTEVRPAAAKLIIQGLDKVSSYSHNATEFEKGLSPQYKQLRYYLDDKIKDAFPAYREAMEPVAKDTKLLRSLEDYGTPEDATRRLKSIKNVDRYRNEMPLLKQLEERTGQKFTQAIEPFANPETNKALHEALPEFGNAKKAIEAHEALQEPRMKRAMQEIENTSEFKAHEAARAALEAAKAKADALGLTQNNLQGKLVAAQRGKNIEALRKVGNLPEMDGKSIPEILEHMRVRDAFEKGATNGSRNVNMYGGALGALGGALTGHFYLGAGVGGALGGFMDKYGPQVTKKLLDGYAHHSLHVGTLTALERASQKTSQAISTGSKAIFSGHAGTAMTTAKVSPKTHQEFADHLQDFASNPSKMIDTLDQATKPIFYSAPKTAGAIQQTTIRATNFLNSKLPQMPAQKPFSPKYQPSKAEISKFSRYHAIVEDPMRALDQVKSGMLLPETVETLSTVYPKLYAEMKSSIMEELTNHLAKKKNLPYQTRLALSHFLGQPLDNASEPMAMAMTQATLSKLGQGPEDPGAPGGEKFRPGVKLAMSTQSQTPLQALSQGNEA